MEPIPASNNPTNLLKRLNKKQLTSLTVAVLLLVTIPIVLYLLQRQQILKSRAGGGLSNPISSPVIPLVSITSSSPPQVLKVVLNNLTNYKISFDVSCQPAPDRKIQAVLYHFGDGSPDETVQSSGKKGTVLTVTNYHIYTVGTYQASFRCIDDSDYLSTTYPLGVTISASQTITPSATQTPIITQTAVGGPKQVSSLKIGNLNLSLDGNWLALNLSSFAGTDNVNLIYIPVNVTYSDGSTFTTTIAFNYQNPQNPISASPSATSTQPTGQPTQNPSSSPTQIQPTVLPSNPPTLTPTPSQPISQGPQAPTSISALVDGKETPFVNNAVSLQLNGQPNQKASFYIFVIAKYGNQPDQAVTYPVKIQYQPLSQPTTQAPKTTLTLSPDASQLVNGQSVTLNFSASYLEPSKLTVKTIHTSIWPGITSESEKNKVQPVYQGFVGNFGKREAIVPFYVEYLAEGSDGSLEDTQKMSVVGNPQAANVPKIGSSSCLNSQVTLSWSGNFDHYLLRVDNLKDGWDGSCSSSAGDFCNNNLVGSTVQFSAKPGSYQWWIHGVDSSGKVSLASAFGKFDCQNVPTNLSSTCQGNTGTFSWEPMISINTITHYLIRIDDLSNGWGGYNIQPGDILDDTVKQANYTTSSLQSGHSYQWWVHAVDGKGNTTQASEKMDLTCSP